MTQDKKGRVTVLCSLFAVVALSASILPGVELGDGGEGRTGWDVIIEHFGIDPEEIESSVTLPLETELSRLEGIVALRSVSEYGKSRVSIDVSENVDSGAFFMALSDAVERVSATLPPAAQRPRIVASGGQSPAYIAALEGTAPLGDLRDWVDREVKPALEKREGVGEVEVGGGEPKEVHVLVDEGKASSFGVTFDALANALQKQDILLPAGTLSEGSRERALSVNGRLSDLTAVGDANIALSSDASVPLRRVANVVYAEREPENISRLDGRERVVLLVHASGSANLILFSQSMARVRAELQKQGITSKVIVDKGKTIEDSLWQTIRALFEGLGAVLVVLPLLTRGTRRVLAIVLIVPLSLTATMAALAILGWAVDRFVLAGFAVALGTILDFAILIARSDQRVQPRLLLSLGTALVTMLLFLAPLAFLDFVWPGIRTLAVAVGLLLTIAFVFSAVFLPVLRGSAETTSAPFARVARRAVFAAVLWSTRNTTAVLAASLVISLFAVGLVILSGASLTPEPRDEIAAHVEFESEASLPSVDERTSMLVDQIRTLPGVTVQSLSKPGSADLTVGWDAQKITRARLNEALIEAGRAVEGAFVYLPEAEKGTSVQLTLIGDDNVELRDLAQQASRALSPLWVVSQVVLNFKDAPRRLSLRFDHAKIVMAGLTAADAASSLRWNLYGPVALKWLDRDRERDLRIMGARHRVMTRDELMSLPLVGTRGVVRVANVARLVEETGGAKIYHENRRRCVYLTVQTKPASARTTLATLQAALSSVAWPPGYSFRVDRSLFEQETRFEWLAWSLALSVVLTGLLLAAWSQRVAAGLMTLGMVPVALAFPITGAALMGGFSVPVMLGLTLLSGTIVNNAILIVDSARENPRSVYLAIRQRLGPLAITNLTAVLGALPMMLAEAGSLLPTLAVLVAWGALGAAVATVTTIPALLKRFPRSLHPAATPITKLPPATTTAPPPERRPR